MKRSAAPATPEDDEERVSGTPEAANLTEEREFLFRSLDDLDRARDDGDIDDATYATLHSDYTARAAAVVRALRGDEPEAVADGTESEARPRASRRRRVLTVTGVVAFAAAAALALSAALGARLPGQTVTGGVSSKETQAANTKAQKAQIAKQLAALQVAVAAKPDDETAVVALARFYLSQQQLADALKQYDAAAKLDPNDPEPGAYGGWVMFLAGQAASPSQRPMLVQGAIERLRQSVAANPDYPDARFFGGMILLRGMNDPKDAVGEFQRYLLIQPAGPLSDQVRTLLADAVKQAGLSSLASDAPAGSGTSPSSPGATPTSTSTPAPAGASSAVPSP